MVSRERFYFSHDFYARHDNKLVDLRMDYGAEGYGWYWMLVEALHEQDGHKLPANACALAMQTQCDGICVLKCVNDCIEKYHLFERKGHGFFGSASVDRRSKEREMKSDNAKKAAGVRWKKPDADAYASADADAMLESKGKESKGKESKYRESHNAESAAADCGSPKFPKRAERIFISDEAYAKLLNQPDLANGDAAFLQSEISKASDWALSKGRSPKDGAAFMRNWLRRANAQARRVGGNHAKPSRFLPVETDA